MVEIIEDLREYNYLLVIIFFFFGILSFYLFKRIKSIKNSGEFSKFSCSNYFNSGEEEYINSIKVDSFIIVKKDIVTVFFIGTMLRTLSILGIFLINNKNSLDYISLLNLILHIIPSYIFIYEYISFIEYAFKRYELKKYDHEKLIIKGSFRFIVIFLVLINFVFLVVTILFRKTLTTFFYFTSIILTILYLLVSYVYFKEGLYLSISSKFKYKDNNGKIRYAVRIITASIIIGISYLLLGVINFLISLGFFKSPYQNWINHNIYDFLWFLIAEFLAVFSITLKKRKSLKKKMSKPQNEINQLKEDAEPLIPKMMLKIKSQERGINKLEMKKNYDTDNLSFSEDSFSISDEDNN